VTVEQFMQFCKDNRKEYIYREQYAPTKDCPAIDVSWYAAAEYCNWLSQREGIAEAQWCYEPNQQGEYAEDMRIAAGYLKLSGYRLPTEAEWEYACRAGSTVGYSFGEPAELLEGSGWFAGNSLSKAHRCGTLKPNDLGLFDMHGNVWQWTHGGYTNYTNRPIETEDGGGEQIQGASVRMLRGGCWDFVAGVCRAAYRGWRPPAHRDGSIGFRLARVPVEVEGK
jgi:formylglycine-generating enzyme required for sulfatase activity